MSIRCFIITGINKEIAQNIRRTTFNHPFHIRSTIIRPNQIQIVRKNIRNIVDDLVRYNDILIGHDFEILIIIIYLIKSIRR
jgi:hypothetical protein